MTRALLALAALAAAVALSRSPAQPPATPTPAPSPAAAAPTRTPAPPQLPASAINQQDRTSRAHCAREARAFDKRPLLDRLPLERGGVRIDLTGLAPDDRTTVLSIDPGTGTRAHARAVYQQALRQAGDPAAAYVLEWAG